MFNVQVHDHLYTTSAEERDRARGLGYVEESVEGYCSASRLPGTGLGYVEEEITCYVW